MTNKMFYEIFGLGMLYGIGVTLILNDVLKAVGI